MSKQAQAGIFILIFIITVLISVMTIECPDDVDLHETKLSELK